jgi:SOS-response transcriptional repressor LexA
MKIKEWVKTCRKAAQMTQTQLGEHLGKSKASISHWETGMYEPSPQELATMSSLFGTPLPPELRGVSYGEGGVGARKLPILSCAQAKAYRVIINAPSDLVTQWTSTDCTVSPYAFLLTVSDESNAPDLRPGDDLVVDPEAAADPGDIVLAVTGTGRTVLRKYRPRGDEGRYQFELAPINPDWPTFRSETDSGLSVIGVMIEHRRYRPGAKQR